VWRGLVRAGPAPLACRAVRPGLLELLLATREDHRLDQEEAGQDEHDGGERIHEQQIHAGQGQARRLGRSRQATGQMVEGLVGLGLLQVADDPARRGGRLVCLTEDGHTLALTAYGILLELEQRLGAERVEALRSLLSDIDVALDGTRPAGPVAGG
jgi:DNA-binding MarR family transcriptional regulator